MKCVYLEGNGFKKIEGLEVNVMLRALYLQENVISKMENLSTLVDLRILNLDDNCLTKIEGLSTLVNLDTLQLKRNRIGAEGISDLEGLLEVPSLSVVDLQENRIDDETCVEEIFVKMPQIAVLYTQGNPFVKKIRSYKKTVISKIPSLKYLDDRPVFDEDRRYAEAFAEGGLDAEREERKKVKVEKDEKHQANHDAFKEMIRKAKAKREEEI